MSRGILGPLKTSIGQSSKPFLDQHLFSPSLVSDATEDSKFARTREANSSVFVSPGLITRTCYDESIVSLTQFRSLIPKRHYEFQPRHLPLYGLYVQEDWQRTRIFHVLAVPTIATIAIVVVVKVLSKEWSTAIEAGSLFAALATLIVTVLFYLSARNM